MNLDRNARHLRRGWMLRTLEKSNGETNDKLLQMVLADVGYDVAMPVLHADLRYLEEKGYVTIREANPAEAPFMVLVADLTAKGRDLLDGSIADVGIAFSHKP